MIIKVRLTLFAALASLAAIVAVSATARAFVESSRVPSEGDVSIRDRLKEEERWGTFVQDMFGWTQPAKCLSWPKPVQDRLVAFRVKVSSLQAKLAAFPDGNATVSEIEADLPNLTADRLELIRSVYTEVLQVKDSKSVDKLFRNGKPDETSK